MALKKFARGDVILPAVVFLLTFVVALFSLPASLARSGKR